MSESPHTWVDLSRMAPKWSKKMKARRALWQWFAQPILMKQPIMGTRWRNMVLRWFGAKIGNGCYVAKSVSILMPWNLEMGDVSIIGPRTSVYNFAPIKIGAQSCVSQDVTLCTGTHDFEDVPFPLIYFPITIGNSAWVAAQAFVCPGVTIGDGVVVGARSVVTKDLPEWMVCAGNPCKPLKPRVVTEKGIEHPRE